MDTVYFFFQQMLLSVVPLLIVALGGIFSERGGVLNFSLEGLMLAGAFCGAIFIRGMQDTAGGSGIYLIALLIAGIAGSVVILMHAVASINLSGKQSISGMSINLLLPALTIVIARALFGVLQVNYKNSFLIGEVPGLSQIPVIGDIFFKNTYISTLVGVVVLVATVIVFTRTRFGMRLHACGENPQAAASMGINVQRTRYIGMLISGFLAGMGGLAFVIPSSTEYSASVAGYGYLALAVVIFGQWRPLRILGASVFFGLMKTLANVYTSVPFLVDLGISNYFFKMAPYLATIIVLVFTSQKSKKPRALGVPYDQSAR